MAITPSGPSTNVWFDRPLPTSVHTPGATAMNSWRRRSLWAKWSSCATWPMGPIASTAPSVLKLLGDLLIVGSLVATGQHAVLDPGRCAPGLTTDHQFHNSASELVDRASR